MKKLSFLLFTLIANCIPTDPPIEDNSETVNTTEHETPTTGSSTKENNTTTNQLTDMLTISSTSETNEITTSSTSTTSVISTSFNDVSSDSSSDDSTTGITECGNSIVEDFEECDDGNIIDDDDCSNECFLPRRIFLSNENINSANFGGIDVADEFCQFEADVFNISGTFKAWLSDDFELNDPYYRFTSTNYTGWYRLLNESKVAKGWLGLSSRLLNPINITSSGSLEVNEPPMVKVWNAVGSDGKINPTGTTCNSWTSIDMNLLSYAGSPQETGSEWYSYGLGSCGSEIEGKLYCFQIE